MAIGMTLKRADGPHDLAASKFFGIPTIPGALLEELEEDLIFVAQIRLADIAELDKDNVLPHTGYLYFFVGSDADLGEKAKALVRYCPEEPDIAVDEFNDDFCIDGTEDDWLITFSEVDDGADGNKLLGEPCGWPYEDAPKLLLQYDPLDSPVGFLSEMDGVAYFFFGKDNERFTDAVWHLEYS